MGRACIPGLIETLSERELQMLGLLAAAEPNWEIADEIYVAVDTSRSTSPTSSRSLARPTARRRPLAPATSACWLTQPNLPRTPGSDWRVFLSASSDAAVQPAGTRSRWIPDARRTLHRPWSWPRQRFHRGIYLRVMKRKAPVPTVVLKNQSPRTESAADSKPEVDA